MSPTLFSIHLQEIIKGCFNGKRRWQSEEGKWNVRFVDDTVVESKTKLIDVLNELNRFCENKGTIINKKKTKCTVTGKKVEKIEVRVGNEVLEQVEKFKYLESIITEYLNLYHSG